MTNNFIPCPDGTGHAGADDIEHTWWIIRSSSPILRLIGILILLAGIITAAPGCRAEEASNPPAAEPGDAATGQPAAGQSPARPAAFGCQTSSHGKTSVDRFSGTVS